MEAPAREPHDLDVLLDAMAAAAVRERLVALHAVITPWLLRRSAEG